MFDLKEFKWKSILKVFLSTKAYLLLKSVMLKGHEPPVVHSQNKIPILKEIKPKWLVSNCYRILIKSNAASRCI